MMTSIRLLLLLVLFATAPTTTTAQDCIPVTDTALQPMVGEWDVTWTYRTGTGRYVFSEAQSTIRTALAGCAINEVFVGAIESVPYEENTTISAHAGGFDRFRADSNHGRPYAFDGHTEADSLVFEMELDLGDRVIRSRHIYFGFSEGGFEARNYVARGADATWEIVQQRRYRRSER